MGFVKAPSPPYFAEVEVGGCSTLGILDLMRFIDHSDGRRWAFDSLIFKKTCTLMVCADPVHV